MKEEFECLYCEMVFKITCKEDRTVECCPFCASEQIMTLKEIDKYDDEY